MGPGDVAEPTAADRPPSGAAGAMAVPPDQPAAAAGPKEAVEQQDAAAATTVAPGGLAVVASTAAEPVAGAKAAAAQHASPAEDPAYRLLEARADPYPRVQALSRPVELPYVGEIPPSVALDSVLR